MMDPIIGNPDMLDPMLQKAKSGMMTSDMRNISLGVNVT